MNFDIQGQLNNMKLSPSKAMWPLFEAVVNSIQSIEDLPIPNKGKITILARKYQTTPQLHKFQTKLLTLKDLQQVTHLIKLLTVIQPHKLYQVK